MDRCDSARSRFQLRRILVMALVLYVVASAVAWLGAGALAFQPPEPSYQRGDPGIVVIEEHGQPSLALRYQPGPPGGAVLLLSHGNAEDLGHLAALQHDLAARGIASCAWDYPGYGASTGSPGFAAVEQAVLRVYDWLGREQGVDGARIVLWGRSLGSGPSCWLAARRPVAGLILESGFTSLYRVLTRWPLLPFDRWDNEAVVAAQALPVLLIHSRDDEMIAFHHAEALAVAAGERAEALWLDGVRHNDPDDGQRLAAIVAFARRVLERR